MWGQFAAPKTALESRYADALVDRARVEESEAVCASGCLVVIKTRLSWHAAEATSSGQQTSGVRIAFDSCRVLNAHEKVVFATTDQVYFHAGLLARARADGYRVVVVPETVAMKLPKLEDIEGNPLRDLAEYRDEWNRSFDYDFVDIEELTDDERAVLSLAKPILILVRDEAKRVHEILVSRTMRIDSHDNSEAVGVWDEEAQRIIIKRDQLRRPDSFLGTLLHEVAHAFSGAPDVDEEFEQALTHLLGRTGVAASSLPPHPGPATPM